VQHTAATYLGGFCTKMALGFGITNTSSHSRWRICDSPARSVWPGTQTNEGFNTDAQAVSPPPPLKTANIAVWYGFR
jgi:hypothetical protein